MSKEELCTWLFNLDNFKKAYRALLKLSVQSQFQELRPEESDLEDIDWNYLLLCASILATNDDGGGKNVDLFQDAALRIAQYRLTCKNGTSEKQKTAALFILNSLSNKVAIMLAEERRLITDKNPLEDSFIGNMSLVANDITNAIYLKNRIYLKNDEKIILNSFQRNFWNSLNKDKFISISAPTSAGKSFIMKTWVQERLGKFDKVIVYLVPTRALLSEVAKDFRKVFKNEIKKSKITLATFPYESSPSNEKPTIYVLTQERLQLLYRNNHIKINALIIDEAYKIADGSRGVLLQYVIERAKLYNSNMKIVYISPQISNPEKLIEDYQSENKFGKVYKNITVNQNLIWVKQERGKKWNVELCYMDENINLGQIELPNNPGASRRKKIAQLSCALGGNGGNIIYANGVADAEEIALMIKDIIGSDNKCENDQNLDNLIDLCKKAIHPEYPLVHVLPYGIGFHYGNMPQIVREEVESLFKSGVINFLICTSTLIEGVNLPCRNIFILDPKRGIKNKMSAGDFWNLAGRAGRWGKDFQGNIICIDPEYWGAERKKTDLKIKKATELLSEKINEFMDYINEEYPSEEQIEKFESIASYYTASQKLHGSLTEMPSHNNLSEIDINTLEKVLNDDASIHDIPEDIIIDNQGVTPRAMSKMLDYFNSYSGEFKELLIPYPMEAEAFGNLIESFERIHGILTNEIGKGQYAILQAIVTLDWMRGKTIANIINNYEQHSNGKTIKDCIRIILKEIEKTARFLAPKYLACYNDLLGHFLDQRGEHELAQEIKDLSLYLELGVNTQTHISLIHLGLSRSTAISIFEFMTGNELGEIECLAWLKNEKENWQEINLPIIAKKEIENLLEDYDD